MNIALAFYKTLIRSVVTYAALGWEYEAKPLLNKLQVFQNKVMKIITEVPLVTSIEIIHE
jgi:hypothetical protein